MTAEAAAPSFRLTDEQRSCGTRSARWRDERIAPRAAEIDRPGEFPWDVKELLAPHDIFALPFPEQYGGLGGDLLTLCLAIEEISRVCATSGLILAVQELGCAADPARRHRRAAGALVAGPRRGPALIAFALTEAARRLRPGSARERAPDRRRRRLGPQRRQAVHQPGLRRGPRRPSSRSPTPTGQARPPRCRASSSRRTRPASGSSDSSTRWASAARRPRSSRSTTCACRTPTGRRGGRGLAPRDADVRAQSGRASPPRPSASRRARSTWRRAMPPSGCQFGRPIGELQMVAGDARRHGRADRGRPAAAVQGLRRDRGRRSATRPAGRRCVNSFAGDTAMRVTTDAVQVLGGYGYIDGVPRRADDARRQDHPALRGHPADPAARHRPRTAAAVALTGRRATGPTRSRPARSSVKIVVLIEAGARHAGPERLLPDGRVDRTASAAVVNANDEYAIEAALKLIEAHGGEVTLAVDGSRPTAPETMRKALAMGAHPGRPRHRSRLAGSDTCPRRASLAARAPDELEYDLVLAGADTSDGRAGIVPAGIATLLRPAVPVVRGEDRAVGGRARPRPPDLSPTGFDVIEAPMPALVVATQVLGEPRYPVAEGNHGRPLEGDRVEVAGRPRHRRGGRRRRRGDDEGHRLAAARGAWRHTRSFAGRPRSRPSASSTSSRRGGSSDGRRALGRRRAAGRRLPASPASARRSRRSRAARRGVRSRRRRHRRRRAIRRPRRRSWPATSRSSDRWRSPAGDRTAAASAAPVRSRR